MYNTIKEEHIVVKHTWKVDGKTYTYNTARDDDRSREDLIAFQQQTNRQDGMYYMIAHHPDKWTMIELHRGLHKDVAEAYRRVENLKDSNQGLERIFTKAMKVA